ncbi:MAG: hypothetical protein ACREQ5_05505, partial [Candidatus Dormibacteria bacterium]
PDEDGARYIGSMAQLADEPPRRYRTEVRFTPAHDAIIRQAAYVEDTTVSNLVLDTVTTCWATRRLRMAVSVVAGMGVGYDRTTEVAGVVGRG